MSAMPTFTVLGTIGYILLGMVAFASAVFLLSLLAGVIIKFLIFII
jgi:hypothetical protein